MFWLLIDSKWKWIAYKIWPWADATFSSMTQNDTRFSSTHWCKQQNSSSFFHYFPFLIIISVRCCKLSSSLPSSPLPRLVNIYFLDRKLLSVYVGWFCRAEFITRTNARKKCKKICLLRQESLFGAVQNASLIFSPFSFIILIKSSPAFFIGMQHAWICSILRFSNAFFPCFFFFLIPSFTIVVDSGENEGWHC